MNNNYTIINGELYHYGVPGMRWGHKRGPKASSQPKQTKTKTELTPEQKQARNKKIAKGVLAGAGAVAASVLIAKHISKKARLTRAAHRYFQSPALNIVNKNHAAEYEAWKKKNPISSKIWKLK